jgi:alpha,alpha-trehalose phosphorylase
MARENLAYAAQVVEALRAGYPEDYAALVYRTMLELDEVEGWRRAAERRYVPFD